ncbi:glycosyl hydrolase family 99 protein [Nitzschia inconspicua]|uniref:Glycosyl hydrolase family 99 protein n=1 Tax=Nitzschia inconspicua TaxID=303405 RepID=A0A9K3LI95_9STRA|nr:glycosyl hydrolase family 99 protein [Nitzschia inconspicua]
MEEQDTVKEYCPFPRRRAAIAAVAFTALFLVTTIVVVAVSLRPKKSSPEDPTSSIVAPSNDTGGVSNHTWSNITDAPAPTSRASASDDETDDPEDDVTMNPSNVTILTYYYPWYVGDDWSRHGYVGTPLLGLYDTSDPSVAEQHIEWAAPATDVMVISWWGEDGITSDHFKNGFLQASNLHETKFCLLYESIGRLRDENETEIHFEREDVVDQLIEDFLVLKDLYFGHEQYYKLDDGRPVVVMYVTRIFRNFEKQHLIDLQEAIGMDLFIIGDETFFWEFVDPFTARNGVDSQGQSIFDSYTAYNMFVDELVKPGESAKDYMMREALPVYQRWADDTLFYPHVLTSYHDFRGHEPLGGGKEGFLEQLKTFACLPKPETANGLPNMLFVTSFNEFWEGTTIEPTEEYGSLYLDALVEFKQNHIVCTKA